MNIKEELLAACGKRKIECAIVRVDGDQYLRPRQFTMYNLKKDHSQEELEEFLNNLDFVPENSHFVSGVVWLEGNAWLERNDFDYEECFWRYESRPAYPDEWGNKVVHVTEEDEVIDFEDVWDEQRDEEPY